MKILLVLLLSLHTLSAFAAPATTASKRKAGWRESYGGDATVSEFQNIVLSIVEVIKDNELNVIDKSILESLESSVETAKISCGENLVLDGVTKDAINYPLENPGRIVFDCEKWNSSSYSPANKVRLVAHEFLFLSGVDDSHYDVSSKIVKSFFEYRNSTSSSGKFLLNVIRSCDVETFHQMVQEGVDIRYRNVNGMDPIHASFAFECWTIAGELVEMGVAPTSSSYSKTNSIALLVQKVANNYYSFNEKNYSKSLEILKTLTSLYPELTKETYNEAPAYGKPDNFIFSDEFARCENKNILLMVAQGFKNIKFGSAAYLGQGNVIEGPVYMDVDFTNDLIKMGFSQDEEDSCGRSARKLIDVDRVVPFKRL